uniref:Protein NDNF C-terminal domain-containing protein n=1 Tax=Panagrolaimus sp. PS1159 TaxID=55785 RepID=A0AC35GIP6_9BILA
MRSLSIFTNIFVLLFFVSYVWSATTIHIERVPHLNLDDGVEHAIRLTKDQHSVYYFHLPARKTPLFMAITPCSSQVYWRLSAPLHVYNPPNVHPNSAHFNNLLHVRLPPLIEIAPESVNQMTLLGGQADEKRMNFFNNAIDADYVVLNLTAPEDTTVRVFITTIQTRFENQYPPLPRDGLLHHDIYNDHDKFSLYNIRLRWQMPITIANLNSIQNSENRYKFCVMLTKKPLYTLCPGKNVINEAEHCVNQSTTQLVIEKLKSRGALYATLFVRDSLSQKTSSLHPIEIKLPIDPVEEEIDVRRRFIRAQDESTVFHLFDGVVDEWIMPPIRHDVRNYNFYVPKMDKPAHVQVVVRVCAGSVEIRIDKAGKRIKTFSHVTGTTRRFIIFNNNDDTIRIQIVNHRNKESAFDIWASTRPELNPFPQLPDDANLHAQSEKCNSADLQFYRVPDEHVAYCLYAEKIDYQSTFSKININASEQCWPSHPPGDLITCFEEDRAADSERAKEELIHMTVPNLHPDTTYKLVLTVVSMGKPYPREIKYKSQIIKTSTNC